eukprot:12573-Heterococcus_DN1.PRE.5
MSPDSMRAQRERVAAAAHTGSTTGQAFRAHVRAERTEPAAVAAPVLSKRMVEHIIEQERNRIATARALNVTMVINLYNYYTRRMTKVCYPSLPSRNDTHDAIHLALVQDSRLDQRTAATVFAPTDNSGDRNSTARTTIASTTTRDTDNTTTTHTATETAAKLAARHQWCTYLAAALQIINDQYARACNVQQAGRWRQAFISDPNAIGVQ